MFLETSWVERKWKTLAPIKIALDSVDNRKIFFGTDFPYLFGINPVDKNTSIRNYDDILDVYNCLLPSHVATKILFENARNFLASYGLCIPY